jgi:hypothetical protein
MLGFLSTLPARWVFVSIAAATLLGACRETGPGPSAVTSAGTDVGNVYAVEQSSACPIQREPDWQPRPATLRKFMTPMEGPEAETSNLRKLWASSQPTWAAEMTKRPFTLLPTTTTLKPGSFIRVPVRTDQAIIVDWTFAGTPAHVNAVTFSGRDPVGRLVNAQLSSSVDRVIQVHPLPYSHDVTEVVLWVDSGEAAAHVRRVPKDPDGGVQFPCDLALGEEPLLHGANCSSERVRHLKQPVDSIDAAVAVMKRLYVQGLDARGESMFLRSIKTARTTPCVADDAPRHEADIDWALMAKRVHVRSLGQRTLYEWTLSACGCPQVDSFWFKVTSDGWMSLFGCCGQ